MATWLDGARLRKRLQPEVYEAVMELLDQGWKIRKGGHGYRLFCPCSDDPTARGFPVPGSAASAGNTARRIRRNAEHCPDSHALIK